MFKTIGIESHFWLIMVLVGLVNFIIIKYRVQKYIYVNPNLKEGYNKLLKGFLIWMNIPWLVMGVGCTIGGIDGVSAYFKPREGNIYVLAFHAAVIFVWVRGTIWFLFKKGAETIVKYPGIATYKMGFKKKEIGDPLVIKIIWVSIIISGSVAMIAMWLNVFP